MTLDIDRINASLNRSGYAHVSRSVPRDEIDRFCFAHGLVVQPNDAVYTWSVVRYGQKGRATVEGLKAAMADRKRRKR